MSKLVIKYGTLTNNNDITEQVFKKCKRRGNVIYIPPNDCARDMLFGDPVIGTLKSIYTMDENEVITVHDQFTSIYIDISSDTVYTNDTIIDLLQ